MLTKLRYITSFAMVGCALAGAGLGWLHFSFDVHIPGALVGAVVGVFFVTADAPDDRTGTEAHSG